jgi:hypothetical protein
VIANRLLAHAEEAGLLHEAQNAFRPGRSTDQHIYTLSQTVRGRLRQGKSTYAFFLDLKKAYDTVWRDGLMFKLWNKGIRGEAWRYVRSMYAATTKAVRCGQHTASDWFDIDLGTAQGDTLSCILFDIFVDDLLGEVDAASQGVPLPMRPEGAPSQTQGRQAAGTAASGRPPADDAGAAPAAALKALMFADDFTGVAETEEALQCVLNTCYEWCTRWRMAANIVPTKSAVVVSLRPSLRPSLQRRQTTAACVGGRHHSP